jgi:peptidoglycan/LPS O-acetylase OafA/YrhL
MRPVLLPSSSAAGGFQRLHSDSEQAPAMLSVSPVTPPQSPPPERLGLADAVRGPAAFAVMAWHFYEGPMRSTLDAVLPSVVLGLVRHGYLGSRLFFVLAGFGIARALLRTEGLRSALGVFVRQQLRLAPAYWVVVALAFADVALPSLLHPERNYPVPSVAGLAAHLLYVPQLLGVEPLLPTLWFLCVDVQLSLLLAGLFALGVRLGRTRTWGLGREAWCLLLGTPLFMLGIAHAFAPWAPNHIFVPHLPLLALGALVAWVAAGRVRAAGLWVALASVAAAGLATGRPEMLTGAGTALALHLGGRLPALGRVRGPAVLRWVGQRSYCLYLVHYIIGFRILSGAHKLWGAGPTVALLAYAGALGASLVAAAVLERTVQVRARAWAATLDLRAWPAPVTRHAPSAQPR